LGTNEYQQSANVFDAGKSFPKKTRLPKNKYSGTSCNSARNSYYFKAVMLVNVVRLNATLMIHVGQRA
jgi:hypothetical protein